MVAAREDERRCVIGREALAERSAKRRQGERLPAQQLARPRENRVEVDPDEGGTELPVRGELAVEDGPEQRPQAEAVVGRQQMDGAADRGDAHHPALDQQRLELGGRKRVEPSPQRGVRIRRHLCLEPDEPAHR
jgi:hypothetical protein